MKIVSLVGSFYPEVSFYFIIVEISGKAEAVISYLVFSITTIWDDCKYFQNSPSRASDSSGSVLVYIWTAEGQAQGHKPIITAFGNLGCGRRRTSRSRSSLATLCIQGQPALHETLFLKKKSHLLFTILH